jgi:hypothetical protein
MLYAIYLKTWNEEVNITNTDNTSSTVSVSVSTYRNTKTQNI